MRKPRRVNLVGQQFGRLKVLLFDTKRYGRVHWLCLCECGATTSVSASNLKKGHTRSCGCLQRDEQSKRQKRHGMSQTKEMRAWSHAKNRCFNPKDSRYLDYGERGITMCDRWVNSFETFLLDMGKAPTKTHSLDRINVNGNYEPSNCRWATPQQQASNKRFSKRPEKLKRNRIIIGV